MPRLNFWMLEQYFVNFNISITAAIHKGINLNVDTIKSFIRQKYLNDIIIIEGCALRVP